MLNFINLLTFLETMVRGMEKVVLNAGLDKIVYASDGFWYSPFVERAKIEILRLPTPFQTRKLTNDELGMILGGNLAKILQM